MANTDVVFLNLKKLIYNRKARHIFIGLFSQSVGSWALTPLSFLISQVCGQGDNIYLATYLVISSLASGGYYYYNEIVGPNKAKESFHPLNLFCNEASLFLIYSAFILFSSLSQPQLAQGYSFFSLLIFSLAVVISTYFTFLSSVSIYQSFLKRKARPKNVNLFMIGLSPTLVNQVLILSISLLGPLVSRQANLILLVLLLFLPALIQYCVVAKSLSISSSKPGFSLKFSSTLLTQIEYKFLSPPSFHKVIALSLITFIVFVNTSIKSDLALLFSGYQNLIFLALNLFTALLMVISKTMFIQGSASTAVLQSPLKSFYPSLVAIFLVASSFRIFLYAFDLDQVLYAILSSLFLVCLSIVLPLLLHLLRN